MTASRCRTPILARLHLGSLMRWAQCVLSLLLLAPALLLAPGCGGSASAVPSPPVPAAFAPYAAPGPHGTTRTDVGACTVLRPSDLGGAGTLHPVLLWGNGTSAQPLHCLALLTHLASHGFIVVAANTGNPGDGSQMLDGLADLTAQHGTPGSVFFQHVDLANVGASGHSQGGAGALMAGRDARIKATAPIQPYLLPINGGGRFLAASIGQQQGPMLLLSGGADTVAAPETHQRPVFDGANRPVVWATLAGADHDLPFGDAGAFRAPLTAWLKAQLLHDAEAASSFPPICKLCDASDWVVRSK